METPLPDAPLLISAPSPGVTKLARQCAFGGYYSETIATLPTANSLLRPLQQDNQPASTAVFYLLGGSVTDFSEASLTMSDYELPLVGTPPDADLEDVVRGLSPNLSRVRMELRLGSAATDAGVSGR